MPTGVYERTKVVSKETRDKQSKSLIRYIVGLTPLKRKERCEAFQKAGTKAGQTLEGRQKSSDAQKEWWANKATEEEKAKQISYLLKGTLNRWENADSEEERLRQLAPFIKAGNEATRKIIENETKEERLKRLKRWIIAGQKASCKKFIKMTKKERFEYMRPKIIASQKANPSSIEKKIWKELDKLNIKYETQVSICGGMFILDIRLLSTKAIIECNGDWWHNYEVFPEKKIRDNAVDKWAIRNGYKIIWLWEHDIRENPKLALENGFRKLGVI